MARKLMTPAALTTILNTAPAIIQGASKLIKLIREQKDSDPPEDLPLTVEGLKQEIKRIEDRLAANNENDVEQIKLIEELARQNEALATSLAKATHRIHVLTALVVAALVLAGLALIAVAT